MLVKNLKDILKIYPDEFDLIQNLFIAGETDKHARHVINVKDSIVFINLEHENDFLYLNQNAKAVVFGIGYVVINSNACSAILYDNVKCIVRTRAYECKIIAHDFVRISKRSNISDKQITLNGHASFDDSI